MFGKIRISKKRGEGEPTEKMISQKEKVKMEKEEKKRKA